MKDAKNLERLVCNHNILLLEALRLLNLNEKGILIVVDDERRLVGTATDGDIRRAFISKQSFEMKISDVMNANPVFADHLLPVEEIIKMTETTKGLPKISIIPLVSNGKVVDYYEYMPRFHAPIASPVLDGNELKYLFECVQTNWISSQGRFVVDFEEQFGKIHNNCNAVSTMNGTVALHLALVALGIGPNDEVIVPSLTFAATINAVLYTGARPVIVDIDRDSWCISPNEIEKHITLKTKAIIPVHLYGQACDMDSIMNIARKYKLYIVEDCAEALGAKFNNQFVGTFGDVGCFSFFGNKIITTGEGGMCISQDKSLTTRMKKLRDHGMLRDGRLYYHDEIGFNYRMTNMQAAIGLAQLEKLDVIQLKRDQIQQAYADALMEFKALIPQRNFENRKKVCWLVAYLIDNKINDVSSLISQLKEKGVDLRPFFFPLDKMEIYKKFAPAPCPNSEFISEHGFNFPTSLALSEHDLNAIFDRIKDVLYVWQGASAIPPDLAHPSSILIQTSPN